MNIQKQPVFKSRQIECIKPSLNEANKKLSQIRPYLEQIKVHLKNQQDEYHQMLLQQIESKSTLSSSTPQPTPPTSFVTFISITQQMRLLLIQWLIKVVDRFHFRQQTLHLTISLMDYVLINEKQKITKFNLQLLGVAALFMASKYNEIVIPRADKYVLVCGGEYELKQLYQMENYVYVLIGFKLNFPSILEFMGPYLYDSQLTIQFKQKLSTLSRLILMDFNLFNKYKKSHISAVILNYCAKLTNILKFSILEVMKMYEMDQDSFNQCYQIVERLYQKHSYL